MRSFLPSFIVRAGVLALFGLSPVVAENEPGLALRSAGSGFSRPVFVTAPPGDVNRLFVVEQHSGRIRVLHLADQRVEVEPFLTVPGVTRGGEQGLLGLAFHPNYATNGLFFVNYTTTGGGGAGHTEIVRYEVLGDPQTSNAADPLTKTVLLTFPQPESNHNGGWLGFGTDGLLYISTGDGGGGNDQHGQLGNGQNLETLLGKILRIDVDQGELYGIPANNPFAGMAGRREEIWAFGLRNPWRCSVDRLTGDLWIGDVGQGVREEIDTAPFGVGGLNFGWRPREGAIQNPAFPNEEPVTAATDPIHDYGRSMGYSVTGGYVYRGQAIPSLQGAYFFGDYGSGRIWTLRYDGATAPEVQDRTSELNSGSPRPVGGLSSFGEDAAGEIYVCDLDDGEIYRIVSAQPAPLTLGGAAVNGDVFSFEFAVAPGESYTVEWRNSIATGAWQTLTNVMADAALTNAIVSDAVSDAQRFFRVRTP